MSELAPKSSPPYPERMAKAAARKGNGPWGEAIQYWLKERSMRQSHIVEGTGMPANKVSRAANGLDVRMETLRQIAEFFGVPLESILVSPARQLGPEERRRVIDTMADELRETWDRHLPTVPTQRVDPRWIPVAKRLSKLLAPQQKSVIDLIGQYEKLRRKQRRSAGRSPKI